jgi:phage antirepressor YoqD-like protein
MDMFEEKIEQEVQRRVKDELVKAIKNPEIVIAAYAQELDKAKKELVAVSPKVDFYDSVTKSDDWMEMSTAVKSIEYAGKPVGRNKMFALLRSKAILRADSFCQNEPYQKYVDMGYFRIVETKWNNNSGETFIGRKTVISQKGLDFLIKLVNEAYNE